MDQGSSNLFDQLVGWLMTPAISALLLTVGAYLFRGPIAAYLQRMVTSKFDERMEETKAALRENENKISTIRHYLASGRGERRSIMLAKRLQCVETLAKNLVHWNKFRMAVEMVKTLKPSAFQDAKSNKSLREFFDLIAKSQNMAETVAKVDQVEISLARLYLKTETVELYELYVTVLSSAAMAIQLASIGTSVDSMFKNDFLSKGVIKAFPASAAGFDKYGEAYAYYWIETIHTELFSRLKNEIAEGSNAELDVNAAASISFDTVEARARARELAAEANVDEKDLTQGSL